MSGNRYRPLIGLLLSCVGLIAVLALPSAAAAKDRNHDRIPDRWEKNHHLSLQVKQTQRDQDRDGLRNRGEFLADNKPHDEDTDGDGTEDGDENAGTIKTFESGVLTINLFAGGTLSGQVTSATDIECEGPENENENEAGDNNDVNDEQEGDNNDVNDEQEGDDNSGNDEGDENDEQDEQDCSTADLTSGTVVHEAELEASNAGAVFEEIELVK